MIEARVGFNKEAALAMYEGHHEAWGLHVTQSDFLKRMESLPVFIGLYDPDPVGAVIYNGPDVHVALLKRARGQHSSDMFKKCVDIGLERWPELKASIRKDNKVALGLAYRMGFQMVSEDETHYKLLRRRDVQS